MGAFNSSPPAALLPEYWPGHDLRSAVLTVMASGAGIHDDNTAAADVEAASRA
jgi:hypothetical protein